VVSGLERGRVLLLIRRTEYGWGKDLVRGEMMAKGVVCFAVCESLLGQELLYISLSPCSEFIAWYQEEKNWLSTSARLVD
jgi:hypothetical protein